MDGKLKILNINAQIGMNLFYFHIILIVSQLLRVLRQGSDVLVHM